MIKHQTENGQIVAYGSAESSEVKGGYIHFYDVHGEEVGRQPAQTWAVEEPPIVAPAAPPTEPPPPLAVMAEIPSEDPT